MGGVTGYDYKGLFRGETGAYFALGMEGRYVQKSGTRAQNLQKWQKNRGATYSRASREK